ncbi:MAG TPA: hypothetical protein VGK24_15440 [Candidatus Angelobacter sp.]
MEDTSLVPVRKPADVCAASGVYRVVHKEHRAAHTAIVKKGDPFPPCKICGNAVRFHLIKKVTEHARAKRARKRGAGQGN